jgi:hypothetical protein
MISVRLVQLLKNTMVNESEGGMLQQQLFKGGRSEYQVGKGVGRGARQVSSCS